MHLLKESAKPVTKRAKRRKVELLEIPKAASNAIRINHLEPPGDA